MRLYYRFNLSLHHVDEIMTKDGGIVSREMIRQWGRTFGQRFAEELRRHHVPVLALAVYLI